MELDPKKILASKHFGEIAWEPASELLLPFGLPGFEDERRMVAVEVPAQRPLVYLQSTERPDVCFVSLPAQAVRPEFEPELNEDDRFALRMEDSARALIGTDIMCLALLFPSRGTIETNLSAPIIINLHNLRCIQAHGTEGAERRFRLGEGCWEPVC